MVYKWWFIRGSLQGVNVYSRHGLLIYSNGDVGIVCKFYGFQVKYVGIVCKSHGFQFK